MNWLDAKSVCSFPAMNASEKPKESFSAQFKLAEQLKIFEIR